MRVFLSTGSDIGMRAFAARLDGVEVCGGRVPDGGLHPERCVAIRSADVLLAYAGEMSVPRVAWEIGYAAACDVYVVVVGQRTCLPIGDGVLVCVPLSSLRGVISDLSRFFTASSAEKPGILGELIARYSCTM